MILLKSKVKQMVDRAYHVQTGKIITASEADYKGYKGIFKCPECSSALLLKKYPNKSVFAHPASGTDAQRNCRLRVRYNFDSSELHSVDNLFSNREQTYSILKKNLIRCIKSCGGKSIFRFYKNTNEELEKVKLLVDVENLVLHAPQNRGYLYGKEGAEKDIRKSLLKVEIKRKKELEKLREFLFPNQLAKFRKIEKAITCEEDIDQKKVNRIIWCIDFLVCAEDDDLRIKSIEHILGQCISRKINSLYAANPKLDTKLIQNFKVVEDFHFNDETLQSIRPIFSDKSLTSEFYSNMYQGFDFSPNIDQKLFKESKRFHGVFFGKLIDFFADFNWACLAVKSRL